MSRRPAPLPWPAVVELRFLTCQRRLPLALFRRFPKSSPDLSVGSEKALALALLGLGRTLSSLPALAWPCCRSGRVVGACSAVSLSRDRRSRGLASLTLQCRSLL